MDNVQYIEISKLQPFPDNPFKVVENDDFNALVESVREFGILTPIIVRKCSEGKYEVVSGHRRMKACAKAGIEKIPAFVRSMSRNEAIITLVDSNIQRENILPSEKAFGYKMKLEAIKHQGKTSPQLAGKLSATIVGEADGISKDQVWRYIRLTNLNPKLLQMVDDKRIAISPAVELSYLKEDEQIHLIEAIESEDCTPSHSQAIRLKAMSRDGVLTQQDILKVISEIKPNQHEQVRLKTDSIKRYFPKNYNTKQMENTIIKLLEQWQRKRQQSREER